MAQARPPILTLTKKGLYCEAGDFYVDPSRSVRRAVTTHGHSDHVRPGSEEYICVNSSVGVLHLRIGPRANITPYAYGEKFRLGRADVSFHPAGHILGSAQVRIEVDGEVWVVSGDYKRDDDPTCEPFEVVKCDTFLTEATFGLPVYQWPNTTEVTREIVRWWDENRVSGRTSVLFCYSLGKAQRVLAEMQRIDASRGRKVYVHATAGPMTEVYRRAGIDMVPTELISDAPKEHRFEGDFIIAPPGTGEAPWTKRITDHRTGFASGWMMTQDAYRRRGYDRGFIVSDHADWPSLVRTVLETKAKRVLVMHTSNDVLARHLRKLGLDAENLERQTIESPVARQMDFWPG